MNKKRIFIIGHKNPDTDSVCSAIGLSYLKNKLGYNTIPCILGGINSETKYALDYFKFKLPLHLNDVKLQIRDVNYHKNNYIDKNSTLKYALDYMNKYSLTGIPVVEEKNKYFGLITLKEIAGEVINGNFYKIDTSYGNIIDILNGNKVLKYDKEIKGTLITNNNTNNKTNNLILISNNNDIVINSKVKLIIFVSNQNISNSLLNKLRKNKINAIRTSYDYYEVSKLLTLSNYVKNFVINKNDSITFNEIDYLSDYYDRSKQYNHTNYPIINSKRECKGVLSVTDTNNVERKQVILVDHNNISQSVEGLEEADIIEVFDHHNIGDIVTKKPINFRNTNCGCTATMIYEMYNENLVEVPKNIAGILASAIISDTLLLTSPTSTLKDREALERLSIIAGINYKDYGMKMLKKGMNISNLSVEQMMNKDFKTYKIDDKLIGIAQLLILDFKSIKNRSNEIIDYINTLSKKEGFKVLTLFLTDVFDNESYCFYNKDAEEIIKNSFHLTKINEGIKLNGILSRKAQILPYIMDILD